ncbi:hypothetical protein Noda2021_08100 [Candidatus Dependentiae bacterium Noda2021]|nr:hypothetical protein Noda2021_08100 [Candidatus Dependentiae bacterium Noda2021]
MINILITVSILSIFTINAMEKNRSNSQSQSQSPRTSPKQLFSEPSSQDVKDLEGVKETTADEYTLMRRRVTAKKVVKALVKEENLEESEILTNRPHTPESVFVITQEAIKIKEKLAQGSREDVYHKDIPEDKIERFEKELEQDQKQLQKKEAELADAVKTEAQVRALRNRQKQEKKLKRQQKEKEQQQKIKAFFENLPGELKKGFEKMFKKKKN